MTIDAPIAFASPDRTINDPARRSITMRWNRPDVTPWEDGALRCVELHVSHDKTRKEIHAALTLVEIAGPILSTRIAPGMYLTIVRRSCARYSAKALAEVADDALHVLNLGQQDHRVVSLMAGEPFAR